MSLLIFIEGNIGAGKTTLIRKLEKLYDNDKGMVMTEPVSNWPSLKLFYEDKRRYAYQLQTEVLESFHVREVDCPPREFYIMERSLASAFHVFSQLNCTEDEIASLRKSYEKMGRLNVYKYNRAVYIYVRTPAMKCFENVKRRGKPTDSYIDLDYLHMLEVKHDEVFLNAKDVIVLDGSKSKEELAEDAIGHIQKIIDTFKVVI